MKFGKRLAAEACRCHWQPYYFDYKSAKRSIQHSVDIGDSEAEGFDRVLANELSKISEFYVRKEEELHGSFYTYHLSWDSERLREFMAELKALTKFATLNYIAVYKAVKKRNRHIFEAFHNRSTVRDAESYLRDQAFFTSTKLATVLTHANVLESKLKKGGPSSDAQAGTSLEEFSCPICLGVLHNPVVLTCAHKLCWGCLVTHCATRAATKPGAHGGSPDPEEEKPVRSLSRQLLQYASSEFESSKPYECPCCRRVQFLDLNDLQVDEPLSAFLADLEVSRAGEAGKTTAPSRRLRVDATPFVPKREATLAPAEAPAAGGLLPPLPAGEQRKLTVVLDMDGTLLSSFSARRSPLLPSGLKTFVAGKGGTLNPGGVLVVERPGLREFLETLSGFAEVVLFTAGVEDYAGPIVRTIDPDGRIFSACLFRGATVRSEHYPCVKDIGRLGRDLRRTVLVDDTPLAFLHQPSNGIPVFAFRSDPDDRFLLEAVLPLLKSLSEEDDVRPVIARRFGMTQWFAQNGFSVPSAAAPDEWSAAAAKPTLVGSPQRHPDAGKASKTLLLMDFDKTVTIADAGETVFAELSPELLPLLHGLEMPASFVSVTNDILAEMQRRGVNRDAIVSTLRELGQFLIPDESRRAIRLAHHRGVDVRILSDCNTVFISHMLTGAKIRGLVREIISNPASFDRAASGISPTGGKAAGHRLVIAPRHDSSAGTGHSCPLCPSNLCKGRELLSLRKELGYERVIYCGDGANDICPALKLEPGDAVCARSGHSLERLVRQKASDIRAQVHFWEEHCDLLLLITRLLH